ncbi:hypothetical protein BIV57_19080 [Mangrovactinospora gilvigrisea]|uniref:Uncharacterized protein n=1 Tax=Mangrovactinospora gilvigrisea TaxID=1428644 RepID=A0A1J7BBB9_9ACTN|nr:PQQ-binding-like beta-propeller repeat protein [Mangrovactinospora gilvigrisea]OIV35901.1 hypothetical protein BIV57_19080 [Mangrovactinospora gilvigrisea]
MATAAAVAAVATGAACASASPAGAAASPAASAAGAPVTRAATATAASITPPTGALLAAARDRYSPWNPVGRVRSSGTFCSAGDTVIATCATSATGPQQVANATTGAVQWSTLGDSNPQPQAASGIRFDGAFAYVVRSLSVHAVNSQTGASLWTANAPSGDVVSSVFADGGRVLVTYSGAVQGSGNNAWRPGDKVVAYSSGGAVLWTHALAHDMTAAVPTLSGGHVYLPNATHDGELALDAGTGAVTGTKADADGNNACNLVAARGTLVVCDEGGGNAGSTLHHLEVVDPATLAVQKTLVSDTALDVFPTITTTGTVVAAFNDGADVPETGEVYGVDASTGTQLFKVSPSAVTDWASVRTASNSTTTYLGTADGKASVIDATTGALANAVPGETDLQAELNRW